MQKLKDILFPYDLRLARKLGWSGRFSVSAECFRDQCRFCKIVRSILGKWHCGRAAKKEGKLKEKAWTRKTQKPNVCC